MAQRLLAAKQIVRSTGEKIEPVRESLDQGLRREEFDTGRGQFDSQGRPSRWTQISEVVWASALVN